MTGAKGSGMGKIDANELSFYMDMMQAEIAKERCKFKICLSDKIFVVAFLPLPHSCHMLPGAAQLCGHWALHQEEGDGVGQEAGEPPGVLHQGHLFCRHYLAKRFSSSGFKERKDGSYFFQCYS